MPTTITAHIQSAQNRPLMRRYTNQFGDGYLQRSRAGINTYIPKWDVKFPAQCSPAECEELWTDLKETDSVDYLLWQSPADATPQKYLAEDLQKNHVGYFGLFEISCTFTRVFD